MKYIIRKYKRNTGFTLVEMIVTLVLLSILLTTSVMGLLAWQDWSDFKQADEYAETMFLAAQNQLSEYNANGTLKEFSKRADSTDNHISLNDIYYDKGEAYLEDSVWTTVDKGTLVSVRCNRGDYKLYTSGKDTVSKTAPIVYELLEGYLYDTSILNDAICIEFSLEDGQVFSVLYSAKYDSNGVEEFVYDNSNDQKLGVVNIATRYEDYRKERIIGYYGVDTLSRALSGVKEKPSITDLSLNNEETLNLSFKVSNPSSAVQKLKYDITVYDLDGKLTKDENMPDGVPVLKLTVNGAVKNKLNSVSQMCPVTRYVKDEATGEWNSEDMGEYPVLAWIESDGTMRIILDAADYQATSASYRDEISTFKTTYSFHRFGVDAENIMCKVKGYGDTYDTTAERQSNSSFVYFGEQNSNIDEELNIANYNYSVSNARHLYNMRFVTDLTANTVISKDELRASNSHYDKNNTIACHFQLTNDIDWQEFVDNGYFYNTGSNGMTVPDSLLGDFTSLKQLRAEDSIDGNDYTISGLSITQAGNSLSALYMDEEKTDNTRKPVGFIATNYGTIENLKLDKISVTSSDDYVGAFAGINVSGYTLNNTPSGILNNLTVMNTDDESYIKGSEYVGGIIGGIEGVGKNGKTDSVSFNELNNYAKVTGKAYVGGIVSALEIPENVKSYITLDDCHNYGAVYAVLKSGDSKDDSVYIGGIAGYVANLYGGSHKTEASVNELITISNSSSSPKYSDEDLSYFTDDMSGYKNRAVGKYVGGIAGLSYYSTLANVSTVSEDGRTGYVFGENYVGGIAGYYVGGVPLSGTNGAYINTNENYVAGCSYVGGIVGCNANIEDTPDKNYDSERVVSSWINNGIVYGCESYVGGIAGYNSGYMYNCNNTVGEAVRADYPSMYNTDYVGGIAGYNSGVIDASSTETVAPAITGGSYVGGVAGCNDSGAVINNYTVSGGYVRGDSASGNYVGGIAGLNLSILMLQNADGTAKNITSSVNEISGKYFVGGSIGGNIINTNGYAGNMQTEPGTTGSTDVATDSSAGQTTDKCYVELKSDRVWGSADTPTRQYSYTIYNNSEEKITNWKLVFHVAKGAKHQNGPYNVTEQSPIETDTEIQYIFSAGEWNGTIWPGQTIYSDFQIQFSNYVDLYSFDVTDIEFFYDGGDGNKVVIKPGNLAITEKNRHEIIGSSDATYKVELIDNNTHINQIKVTNNSDADIIDWYVEIPKLDSVNLNPDTSQSFDIVVESKEENGQTYEYYKLTKKNGDKLNAHSFFDLYEPFDVDSVQTVEYLKQNTKLIFFTTKLQQKTEDRIYARVQTKADMEAFTGNISADAFAGGFIGYTMLVNSTDKQYASQLADGICTSVGGLSSNAAVAYVRSIGVDKSEAQIYIQGNVGHGNVTADDMAGGVLGYADAATFMYIDNANNKASVTAVNGCAGGITSTSLRADNKIRTCTNSGNITAKEVAGGIVGESVGTVSTCVVKADITGALGAESAAYGGISGISGNASERTEDVANTAAITECYFDGNIYASGNGATARIGGIAGINGRNSAIKASVIGADSGNSNTSIHGGLVSGTYYETETACVGGIAGINYGDIVSADNNTSSTDTVVIDNYLGYTGGIVGYNASMATVSATDEENISTGKAWTVSGKANGTVSYVGGIIGYSESGTNMAYLRNYANVSVAGDGNVAGGIVGTLHNQTSSDLTVNKCYNYGDVMGTAYAGGLIGILRYKGVKFTSCSNDGAVTGLQYVDPMVAYKDISDGTLVFTDCTVNGSTYINETQIAQFNESLNVKADELDITNSNDAMEDIPASDDAVQTDTDADIGADIGTDESFAADIVTKLDVVSEAEIKDFVLTFNTDEQADYYKVQLLYGNKYGVIYVEPCEAGYGIYYIGSDAPSINELSACMENPYAAYIGKITDEADMNMEVDTNIIEGMNYDGSCINIELPDDTTFVTLQALVGEDKVDLYESSDIAIWKCISVDVPADDVSDVDNETTDSDAEITDSDKIMWSYEICEADCIDETSIPDVTGEIVTSEAVRYSVDTDTRKLAHILVVSANGEIVSSGYYLVDTDNRDFVVKSKALFADDVYAMIRFVDIGEAGMGDWTQFYTLTENSVKVSINYE